MTKILSPLITEDIDNCRYVRIVEPFGFESDVLKKHGFYPRVYIPVGFVMDYESVPVVRGTNKRGGAAHDYLCRIDSIPVVSKAVSAEVYREIMKHCYTLTDRSWRQKVRDCLRAWIKWAVVRVAWGYWHKHKVSASYEEMRA
jgi:hypothetical protein